MLRIPKRDVSCLTKVLPSLPKFSFVYWQILLTEDNANFSRNFRSCSFLFVVPVQCSLGMHLSPQQYIVSASKKSIGFQSLIILARALGNKKFEAETRFCKFQGCFNVKFWTSKSNATQHKRQFRFSIKVLTIKCMKENSTKSPLMS